MEQWGAMEFCPLNCGSRLTSWQPIPHNPYYQAVCPSCGRVCVDDTFLRLLDDDGFQERLGLVRRALVRRPNAEVVTGQIAPHLAADQEGWEMQNPAARGE